MTLTGVRYGETITATATSNTGYTFTGFSGLSTSTTSPATATITAAGTITASFADTTPPTISSFTTSTTGANITVTVSATDSGSGIATSNAYQYAYSTTSSSCSGSSFTASSNTSYTFSSLSRGTTYYFCVKVYDKAGNNSQKNTSSSISYPTVTLLSNIDIGGSSQTLNFAYNGTTGSDGTIQEFETPASTDWLLKTWGASGGDYTTSDGYNMIGGYGGYSEGTKTTGSKMYVGVGGEGAYCAYNSYCTGGYNGGGNAQSMKSSYYQMGATGGGATHISTASGKLSSLSSNQNSVLIVAGGGGGISYNYDTSTSYARRNGGSAGGYIGHNSYIGTYYSSSGYKYVVTATGGEQTASSTSGLSGRGWNDDTIEKRPHEETEEQPYWHLGTFGQGGYRDQYTGSDYVSISGGGGGWYGGGGGLYISGAGGSGYVNGLTNGAMYCYECTESTTAGQVTTSVTDYVTSAVESPSPDRARNGNGYAMITTRVSDTSKDQTYYTDTIYYMEVESSTTKPTFTASQSLASGTLLTCSNGASGTVSGTTVTISSFSSDNNNDVVCKLYHNYVEDGLVVHYDGRNNYGDQHTYSDWDSTWVNLADTSYNATFFQESTYHDLYWASTKWDRDYGYSYDYGIFNMGINYNAGLIIEDSSSLFTNGKSFSLEVYIDPTYNDGWAGDILANWQNGGAGIEYNEGTFDFFIASTTSSTGYTGITSTETISYSGQNKALISATWNADTSTMCLYKNGVLVTDNSTGTGCITLDASTLNFTPESSTQWAIGCDPKGAECVQLEYKGYIFSVRMYDKALTATEIAHNYEVDKLRFGEGTNIVSYDE